MMKKDLETNNGKDEVDGFTGGLTQDVVFDHTNQERKPWTICGKNCSRSFLVFMYQCLLILILTTMSIIRITLAETCEETTIWVAVLTSSVGYMLPSPRPT